jgi:hypothetical protein
MASSTEVQMPSPDTPNGKASDNGDNAPKPDGVEDTADRIDVGIDVGAIRVSSALQGLLEEHKAQSEVVKDLKTELIQLNEDPQKYFECRKKFLFYAYTQTLKDCPTSLDFDVKVRNFTLDSDED